MSLDEGPSTSDDVDVRVSRALAAAMEGHTQVAVRDATGIDQGRLSRIINHSRGESPTLEELVRIEEAIGVPPGYILGLAGLVTVEGARRGTAAAGRLARTR